MPLEISALDGFGLQGGGADDTVSLNAFMAACKSSGLPGRLPAGEFITSTGLAIHSKAKLSGAARYQTTLKVKAGANTHALYGETTAANWSSAPSSGDDLFEISDLTVDGNRAQNSSGHGLYVYGRAFVVRRVAFVNCASSGMATKFSDTGALFGMEPTFDDIVIDTVGYHGWDFRGPHDAHVSNVRIVDASQSSNRAANGLYIGDGGNGRFMNLHVWHRASVTNRADFAVSSGGTNEFVACHFEGARRLLHHRGGQDVVSASRFYASYPDWGGAGMVVIGSSDNTHIGCTYQNTTGADMAALEFGYGSTASGANIIDSGRFLGFKTRTPFIFGNSYGRNFIQGRGYADPGGLATISGYNATDEINYRQSGTVISVNV